MNLLYVERMNKLTQQIVEVRREARLRAAKPPHPRVGAWRHEMNVERLKLRAEFLEKKRLLLLRGGAP